MNTFDSEGIRKILVAYDFSKQADKALAFGVDLARRIGAEIVLITVVNPRDIEAIEQAVNRTLLVDVDAHPEKQVRQFLEERIEQLKDRIASLPSPHPVIRPLVRSGLPHEELMAEAVDVDLVVMGARGKKSALREALVGSTAEKLFHLCPVPVLSVRLRGET